MPPSAITGDDALTRLGGWTRNQLACPPWGSGLGLARTVLALGTMGTLLATPPQALMSPLAGGIHPPVCAGIAQASIWCMLPQAHLQAARWLSVLILAIVASGWRPRLTGVAHWWIAWSLFASASIQDGGDQITAVLTLLLIPVTLTDSRRWHWAKPSAQAGSTLARLIAATAIVLMKIQVAALYLDAGIAKLGVADWANGTAMFYLFRSVLFAPPPWLTPITGAVTGTATGVAAVTWGAIVLEIALGVALLLPARLRPFLLAAGLLFHDVIALTMGLISFDCAMTGALLLYLLPMGYQIPPARQWRKLQLLRAIRLARPTAPTPHPVLPASPSPAPALAEPAAEVEGTAAVAAAGHDL
jgi:antimicrobial peptide system SdpB family protein